MSKNRYDGIESYLVKRVQFHARTLHQYVRLHHVQISELEQELMLFFVERQHTYNPNKASWKTFVNRILDCAHKRLLRETYTQKYGHDVEHVYFDEDTDSALDCDAPLTSTIAPNSRAHCQLYCDLLTLSKKLPPHLATLLQQLYTMTLQDVAQLTQSPYAKLYYQLQQLRAILKQHGIEIDK